MGAGGCGRPGMSLESGKRLQRTTSYAEVPALPALDNLKVKAIITLDS
jgi:hypothetical protein